MCFSNKNLEGIINKCQSIELCTQLRIIIHFKHVQIIMTNRVPNTNGLNLKNSFTRKR